MDIAEFFKKADKILGTPVDGCLIGRSASAKPSLRWYVHLNSENYPYAIAETPERAMADIIQNLKIPKPVEFEGVPRVEWLKLEHLTKFYHFEGCQLGVDASWCVFLNDEIYCTYCKKLSPYYDTRPKRRRKRK